MLLGETSSTPSSLKCTLDPQWQIPVLPPVSQETTGKHSINFTESTIVVLQFNPLPLTDVVYLVRTQTPFNCLAAQSIATDTSPLESDEQRRHPHFASTCHLEKQAQPYSNYELNQYVALNVCSIFRTVARRPASVCN